MPFFVTPSAGYPTAGYAEPIQYVPNGRYGYSSYDPGYPSPYDPYYGGGSYYPADHYGGHRRHHHHHRSHRSHHHHHHHSPPRVYYPHRTVGDRLMGMFGVHQAHLARLR